MLVCGFCAVEFGDQCRWSWFESTPVCAFWKSATPCGR